jgi:hypothetical protein
MPKPERKPKGGVTKFQSKKEKNSQYKRLYQV